MRRKELKAVQSSSPLLSRESILLLATIVMGACALIILFGTSLPLLSQSTVESSFYDNANLPLAIVMTLLLGVSMRVKWNQEERSVFKRILLPAGMAAVMAIGLFFFGLKDRLAIALVFTSLFALIIAVEQGIRVAKEQLRFIGGTLSHIGLALLLLGILASGKYGHKRSVSLPLNEPKTLFGYTLTYTGDSLGVDGKYRFAVRVERNGSSHTLTPVIFDSPYNNSQMRTPDYLSYLTKDFYIEPVSLEPGSENAPSQNIADLTKDEPLRYGPMTITFLRFEMGEHSKGNAMGE